MTRRRHGTTRSGDSRGRCSAVELPGRDTSPAAGEGTLRHTAVRRTDPVVVTLEPKPSGGHRRMATLSRRDAQRWAAIARRVEPAVRPLLGPEAVGPAGMGRAGLRAALRRARGAAARLAARSPFVVRSDISDFYGSVMPGALLAALRTTARGSDAAAAAAMLEGWGSDGYAGLPVGPPGSAVLAEAVLAQVDEELRPLPFLRWADDYLIAVPSERAGAEVIERLDVALERIGLRRSLPKTAVGAGSEFRWIGTSFPPTNA
ncbi:MAG TPA: RNA-directed DNA polymerase [Actinomycetota bacterium]|nr:RNA-directed DNA polymerase [Actinomycetota bacterium]